MLIGIDASRAATPKRTGTEAYAYHLIRALLPLAQTAGHHLRLYYNQPPATHETQGQVDTTVMPFPRLWTHLRLAAELHRRPPDVFFTPAHVIPVSYFGKSVATIHDLGYHYFPEAHTSSQVRQLTWGTQHNARRSRHILADSQATQDDLSRFYGVSHTKVSVVYPGYDEALRPVAMGAAALLLRRLQITAPYFLFLSTLQPRKNVGRIVEAFAQIAAQVPHQLLLAGKQGWLAHQIMSAIDKLAPSVQARIRPIGFVADEDKAALLSQATALVYPSLFEGFGFPILEAQACGTAVITANNSSLPEVAGNSAHQISAESVTQLAEAMLTIARDQSYRQSLIDKGYDNIRRFSWQTAAAQTLAVLEQVYHA